MTKHIDSRAERAANLERWAEAISVDELVRVETSDLRRVAEVAERRSAVDSELADAVRAARRAGRSWSEIGTMLGVSKQAAQRKYAQKSSAA